MYKCLMEKQTTSIQNQFSRTEIIVGKTGIDKLKKSKILVFGLGGVGSFCVEALARAGIGTIGLCDNDKYCLSNINRQLYATHKTLGCNKTDIAETRIFEINPDVKVKKYDLFYSEQTANQIDLSEYDYIIDAIDSITSKIALILNAKQKNVPIISCMAAGNRLDPTAFEVADIFQTTVCPISKILRSELRKLDIQSLKVVYSKEQSVQPACKPQSTSEKCRQTLGSISFVPSVAGLIAAGEAIKDLLR